MKTNRVAASRWTGREVKELFELKGPRGRGIWVVTRVVVMW